MNPPASQNADPAELDKFSELAHRWWDPESEFKPLHDINPLRLDWIDRAVGLVGKKVLDVGCGGGILAESMAARGAAVTGIDLSDKALAVARLHLLESGQKADYRKIAAEELAADMPASFDVVTCLEMLEHVPDPASTVRACARLVRPGGTVFLLHPQPQSEVLSVCRDRRRIRPQAAAARHPRLRQVHPPRRTGPPLPRRRPDGRGDHRHDLQPAEQDLRPRPEHRRELPHPHPAR
jgi:2-polyprenyl-3-methyl-5-hydroxy-6-metoxy-1,4-benzoquinol methylase